MQEIEPGAINWMTAGRGIVHSERRPPRLDHQPYVNHGIQLWAALPIDQEEVAPAFVHTPASAIPRVQVGAASVRVLVGAAFGVMSPVATLSRALYLDVELPAEASLDLPALVPEMAVYAVDAPVQLDDQTLAPGELAVLEPRAATCLRAGADAARIMVVGGDVLDGPRHIWWNFVSTRQDRIVQAAQQWEAQSMGQIPGEQEWIPLPAHRFRDTGGG